MGWLARVLTRVFFREIEHAGRDRLVAGRPSVVVANHVNGLVDPLVLMAVLTRFPRFLAKDTLFRIWPLVPFLRLARVVPVHRAKDGGDTRANASAFRTCREILAGDGLVAVFPEGISHDEPSLQPLRTGAARIALEAAADTVPGVVAVPVGLIYDDKSRFRSRALVQVGEPVGMERWVARAAADRAAAVRELTAELDRALRHVGPDFRSWSTPSPTCS